MAMAAAAATMSAAVSRSRLGGTSVRGGKNGKFLGYFRGTAMRTFRPLPIAGAHKYFAVASAVLAMKLVNRHERKITGAA